ncbi:MAG: aminoacyl-tRNA hydrolase [Gemmatimonadetes bacterium]|nr:aminoacyl-tRNA hydrolase [Gemmatimonadota bacterium]
MSSPWLPRRPSRGLWAARPRRAPREPRRKRARARKRGRKRAARNSATDDLSPSPTSSLFVKIVAGLGNPGPEYDATRHNAGWWVLDRVCRDWGFGPFRRESALLMAEGQREGTAVILAKPTAYMNRSGPALRPLLSGEELNPSADLLVIVDDAALDVGRVRFRPGGSDGGHNGLRSVASVVGSDEFPRLRIGVGCPPPDQGMADWVLSEMPSEDEERIAGLLPELCEAVGLWVSDGIAPVMNRYNR